MSDELHRALQSAAVVADAEAQQRLLAGDPAAAHDEFVDQERQRHLVQLIGEQLLGELPREVHQVVGRDGPSNEYRHAQRLPGGRTSLCQPQNEFPHAQPPPAFGLSIVKPCFSIVSTKSMTAPER